jgi:hypothetical protein
LHATSRTLEVPSHRIVYAMKRQLSLTSLLLMAVAPLAAQESALPYLPKDTLFAMSVPDFAGSMQRFGQMPMAKMWAEEEVQNFVADLRTLVEQKWKEGLDQAKEMHAQGAMPVDPADLLNLRMGGCTFALTRLSMGVGDFGPQPEIGIIAHLDFGSSSAAWNKLLPVGMSMLEGALEGQATKSSRKVGDVEIVSFVPSTEGTDMALEIAMLPNGLLIGTIGSEVQGVLESMQKKTPVLGATAGFAAATKAAPECQMYFSTAPWGRFVLDLLRIGDEMGQMGEVDVDGIERALTAMGCLKEHQFTETASYVDGKCETRMFHRHEAATSSSKPVDTKFLKWVPKDAVGFSAMTMDMGSAYDTLLKGLNAYDEKFAKQALDQLAKVEEQLGFSIRGDLLGSVGNQMVQWSMPMTTLATPGAGDRGRDEGPGQVREGREGDRPADRGLPDDRRRRQARRDGLPGARRHGSARRHGWRDDGRPRRRSSATSSRRSPSRTATWSSACRRAT